LHEAKGGVSASVIGSVASLFLGDHRPDVNGVLKRLLALGSTIDETANDLLGVISTASIELTQIFTHVVNFYLAPYEPHDLEENFKAKHAEYTSKKVLQDRIIEIATKPSVDSEALLQGYVREALRLDPVIDGVFRHATHHNSIGPVEFTSGDRLWFDLRAAGLDPHIFENPHAVNPNRPASLYTLLHGDGVFKVLGEEFVYSVTAQVLHAVFSLKNVRRAKGPAGTLRRFKEVVIAPFDEVDYDEVLVKDAALGKDTAFVKDAALGKNAYEVTVKKYKWKAVKGHVAWKWAYLNPEDSNRLTNWATGLTINYDD